MLVQLQMQPSIHYSGHHCTPVRKQQEEETHQEVPRTKGVAAPVNGIIKVDVHQEEALGQEERDHLQKEEDQEEARRREELRPSSQEEEQVIQGLHHLHLQALYSLHAQQIHGIGSIQEGPPEAHVTVQLQGMQHIGDETATRVMV